MKNRVTRLALFILSLGICLFVTVACSKKAAGNEITLPELNRVLVVMAGSPTGAPQTVDELLQFPTLKGRPMPAAPAGKKYVIAPSGREIILVDR